ncbi:MAG: hypothetical protein Q9219_004081 [cf. Caloplaca sp. 3 TL-2023]
MTNSGYIDNTVLERAEQIPSRYSAAWDLNKITGYVVAATGRAPQKAVDHLEKAFSSISSHPTFAPEIPGLWPDSTGTSTGSRAGYAHSADALKGISEYCVSRGVKFIMEESSGKVVELLHSNGAAFASSSTGTGPQKGGSNRRCVGVKTADGKRHTADVTICALGAYGAFVDPEIGPFSHGTMLLCPLGSGYTNTGNSGTSLPPGDRLPPPQDFIPSEDERKLRQLLRETFPWMAERPFVEQKLCWFADTADSEYCIDFVPDTDQALTVLSGDAGHGFKMMPSFGKWVADLLEAHEQSIPRWQWRNTDHRGKDWSISVSWRIGTSRELRDLVAEKSKTIKARLTTEPKQIDFSLDLVRRFLTTLERQAGVSHFRASQALEGNTFAPAIPPDESYEPYLRTGNTHVPPDPVDNAPSNDCTQSESDFESRRESTVADQGFTKPLVPGKSAYVAVSTGQPSYLGTSSNWSFGRRISSTAHERLYSTPLPAASLLFEGQTYDLGWDGRRESVEFNKASLPTSDFALFLINAVKFHCGQRFHLFDEQDFMRNFAIHHDPGRHAECSNLWNIHYLLILALGKALIVRVGQDRRPPGASLYVQAMKLLPDTTYLCHEPIQSMEILCCAALYLQCLDMRSSAYSYVWWTVWLLDCHLSSLMGVPLALTEQDVTAQLPTFTAWAQNPLALSIHVRLAKITALILKTVYGEEGRMDRRFVASIKNALECLASVNDERNNGFPLNLKTPAGSISRLSAYLHLFHQVRNLLSRIFATGQLTWIRQCIILTSRPLLYALWQKKVESGTASAHVSSAGSILTALQAQSLLESFVPFDLEFPWSCAVVLLLTRVVEPSLIRKDATWLHKTHLILDEMISRGNLIASSPKDELQQLDDTLTKLHTSSATPHIAPDFGEHNFDRGLVAGQGVADMNSGHPQIQIEPLQDWNSEEGLSGDQLNAVADSLDFTTPDWRPAVPLGQIENCLY